MYCIIEIQEILLADFLLHREEQGLATPGPGQPSRGTTMYTPRPPDPRDLETLPYWRVTLSLKVNPLPKKGEIHVNKTHFVSPLKNGQIYKSYEIQ